VCVGFKEWSVMIALTGCEPVQPPEEFVELLQTECVESSCIESLWTAGRSLGMLTPQGAGLGVPTASKTRPSGSTSDQFGEVTQKFQLFPPASATWTRTLSKEMSKDVKGKSGGSNLDQSAIRGMYVLYSAGSGRSQQGTVLSWWGR